MTTVAREAAQERIPIDTVALGTPNGVLPSPDPLKPPVAVPPDPQLMQEIAQLSGGRSFVATDADALGEVFRTIDALEKSKIRGHIPARYDEHYAAYAGLALALLLAERFLRHGKLGRLP